MATEEPKKNQVKKTNLRSVTGLDRNQKVHHPLPPTGEEINKIPAYTHGTILASSKNK